MTTRVMLVDDAVVVRHVLSDALSKDPDLHIVGTASDGVQAIELLPTLKPDVVVLDVEMPKMDGIETLGIIKKRWPQVKVIMFSTLTSRGAAATMDALMLGADDYVCKPANVQSVDEAMMRVNAELLPRIKALHKSASASVAAPRTPTAPAGVPAAMRFGATAAPAAPPTPAPPLSPISPRVPSAPGQATTVHSGVAHAKPRLVVIAVSTGGPNALASFLPQLPADLAAPVLIVQHIPPMFSKALADRLDAKSSLSVSEGENGAFPKPGEAWVAPGDFHMVVKRDGATMKLELNQDPPENSCRPSADVLFRSAMQAFGGEVLGVVLTGMGNDGLKGSQELVKAGSKVIIQDEATSVVWGMPGAVAQAGIADRILPLQDIAGEIVSRVGTSLSPTAGIRTSRS